MMSTENRPVNKGRYADTRILIKEMDELIADIQTLAPDLTVVDIQRQSNLPTNELYKIKHGAVLDLHRARRAIRYLKELKSFIEKTNNVSSSEDKPTPGIWGKQLRELNEIYNLSHGKIAAGVGIDRSTVSAWFRGEKKPTYRNTVKIQRFYENKAESKPEKVESFGEFSKKINDIKKHTKWSDAKIGKVLNVSEVTVGGWRNGRRFPRKENQHNIDELLKEVEAGKETDTPIVEESKNSTEPTETKVETAEKVEIKQPEQKYSFIERIKILFKGEI